MEYFHSIPILYAPDPDIFLVHEYHRLTALKSQQNGFIYMDRVNAPASMAAGDPQGVVTCHFGVLFMGG